MARANPSEILLPVEHITSAACRYSLVSTHLQRKHSGSGQKPLDPAGHRTIGPAAAPSSGGLGLPPAVAKAAKLAVVEGKYPVYHCLDQWAQPPLRPPPHPPDNPAAHYEHGPHVDLCRNLIPVIAYPFYWG